MWPQILMLQLMSITLTLLWVQKDYEEGNGNDSTTEEYCSSDGNVDINGEDSNESYKNKCLQELKSEELLHNLIDKLEQSKHLRDFMMLIKHLAYGTIPMDNIVFLLMLERVRFQSCSTTIAMRYCKVTKLFWSIVYRLCKSTGLKFFSVRGLLVAVGRCNTQVRLSLIYVSGNLLDLRYLGSSEECLTFGHT